MGKKDVVRRRGINKQDKKDTVLFISEYIVKRLYWQYAVAISLCSGNSIDISRYFVLVKGNHLNN